MFNDKYNHSKPVFTFNADDLPYATLDEVVAENGNKVMEVKGVFVNKKSKYGPRPVLITSTIKINLPKHFLSDVESIIKDPEAVEAINSGHCGFEPNQYQDKNGVTRNSGNFIDI